MFDKKGLITVDKSHIDEERLMGLALDVGAEDVRDEDGLYEVVTRPEDFEKIREHLEKEKVAMVTAQVSMIPKGTVTIDERHAEQILKLTEELEDHDDVQNVAANFVIPNELMEKAS
jgi:transcriptional/translational regulatory protein YebC/TACO1